MKTLVLTLAIALSASAHANFIDYTLQVTTGQAIGITVANILNASSQATTNNKIAAVKIQNDIVEYAQTGEVSLFLAEKIKIVTDLNSELSEQEAVDVLIEATEIILK